jgi:NADPH:quinone reductase-like Zn-dependent oxidoreductase
MESIVFESINAGLLLKSIAIPLPGPNQVVVKILAASLNRRDYWMTVGLYPKIQVFNILFLQSAN